MSQIKEKQKKLEIEERSIAESHKRLREISIEIYQLINENELSKTVTRPHLIREKKKERARILTSITKKERENESRS